MTKIMKAGQEITSKSVNANIILNEQTRQANELLRQQRIAKVEEDLQVVLELLLNIQKLSTQEEIRVEQFMKA